MTNLTAKAMRFQKMTGRFYGGKRIHGAARFFETSAGRVRVLCYGLEYSRTLPLFANAEQLSLFPPTLVLTAGYDSLCTEAERL
jgi:acetyl esterase/lipase